MATRKRIPRAIKYQVLYEAGHRCAVCCETGSLELAHIIPWRTVKDHTADNLICLCANCHTTADKERWAPPYFRKYKKGPCVTRMASTELRGPKGRRQVVIEVPGRVKDFDAAKRRDVESAVSAYLGLGVQEVVVRMVEEGSVKITLDLPAEHAERLLAAHKSGDLRLRRLLELADTIEVADPFEHAGAGLLDALSRLPSWAWLSIAAALIAAGAVAGGWLFSWIQSSTVPGRLNVTQAPPDVRINLPARALVSGMGDAAWLGFATVLAVATTIPGLALYYAGMVRAKNALSVVMQVLSVFALVIVLWFICGYSFAFTESSVFFGGLDRLFLHGAFSPSGRDAPPAPTLGQGVTVPEPLFVAFQAALAALACSLVVGALAERIKLSAILMFSALWLTFSYLPLAHMTWYWVGADAYAAKEVVEAMNAKAGLLWQWGVMDFAGGLVVHLNAAVASLVGAYFVGKRIGYGREAMRPHSLLLAMIGASLMWIGWFGIHAGAALKSPEQLGLAVLNTLVAPAAGLLAWSGLEAIVKGRPSTLGAISGALSGLVAISPAAGIVGVTGALVIGVVAGVAGLWGVTGLKRLLGVDDALDVFGIHGIAAAAGVLLAGVYNHQAMGGPGLVTDWTTLSIGSTPRLEQVFIQLKAILLTIVWSGVVAAVAFKVVDVVVGLRVGEDEEREGLDRARQGEAAYKERGTD